MRITSSMYYKSLYGNNNARLSQHLFDVNKQIASGLQIQYAKDDVRTFAETMLLDNEVTTIRQVKKSTQSGYKMSNQSDIILNEFESNMNRVRTLLIQSANGTNDTTSLDAISSELREIEEHFKGLANTSINGQYLFSGTAVDIKPIADDGTYMGNYKTMSSFTGSKTLQQFNISGGELFLGEESLIKREITTSIVNKNLTVQHPSIQTFSQEKQTLTLTSSNTIRDLMGDTDAQIDVGTPKHYFYLNGVRNNGEAFKEKLSMSDDENIKALLDRIGEIYGNTPNVKVVNVSLNTTGQIVIQDKISGSSKLDFHMVGAVDFSGGSAANVTDIDLLDGGETNFIEVLNPTVPPANPLFIKEFIRSGYNSADGAASNIDGLVYDRIQFEKSGSRLTSGISQIVKSDNSFAVASTKISEVADLTQLPSVGSLDGTQFKLVGTNLVGTPFDVAIDFSSSGSTFSVGGSTFEIFDVGTPRSAVSADEMTYQQLMDVVNMTVTGNLPTGATAADYDSAITSSNFAGGMHLSHDAKLGFYQAGTANTKVTMALYDANSGDFSTSTPASVLSFNANDALSIRDPKTNFFKTMDEMITAVEEYKLYPDATEGNSRAVGIENAIAMMDDIQNHVFRSHSKVGSQSNALTIALERSELLEISTMTLRSKVIDTDLAEASLSLTQLSLNYEAMLSTVGRISKLTLVNYL